jgi:2-aminoethylphosphonate dioxygenase
MLRTPVLTESQLNEFRRDGYLMLRQAFDAPAMARVEQWTCEIAEAPEVPGRQWVYHERSLKDPGELLINRIERISPFHDGFRQLTEALRGPVGQLLGEDAVLFKEKINFKMPGGGGFKPHQDSQAGWEDYASYFISALVCIDEATIENGCLQMVAGHQHRGLFRSWEPLTEADMAGMNFEYCPTQPGDVVFFDSYAPHASEANMSDRIRRIYFATYNRLSEGDHLERYYADKHRSFPPDIERETGREYVFRV